MTDFGVLFEPTQIFLVIHQFTKCFIEFVFVATNQLVGSKPNMICPRQTCGQRSGIAAESKRRALESYFPARICYMFWISKCSGEWDLGLCTFPGLANRMPLHTGDLPRIWRPNAFFKRSPTRRKVQWRLSKFVHKKFVESWSKETTPPGGGFLSIKVVGGGFLSIKVVDKKVVVESRRKVQWRFSKVVESRHCNAAFCLQVPEKCTDLDLTLFYIWRMETYSKFACGKKMLALGVHFPQPYSSAGRVFAASTSRLYDYQPIGSFPRKRIWWNTL